MWVEKVVGSEIWRRERIVGFLLVLGREVVEVFGRREDIG